jgi:hypothetical protein
MDRDADLFEVVLTLGPGGRLPDFLHGRHQEGNQDRDDRDDHQQLDQREADASRAEAEGIHGVVSEAKKNMNERRVDQGSPSSGNLINLEYLYRSSGN